MQSKENVHAKKTGKKLSDMGNIMPCFQCDYFIGGSKQCTENADGSCSARTFNGTASLGIYCISDNSYCKCYY